MKHPKALMIKPLAEYYYNLALSQWYEIYHNGTMRDWPDIDNYDEWEAFWNWLSDEASLMIVDLQYEIKETFGFDWKIYQWGRSGATFAPDIFDGNRGFNRKGIDDYKMYGDYIDFEDCSDYDNDPEYWRDVATCFKEHYLAFKLINDTVRREAAYTGRQYDEYRKEVIAA